MERLVEREEVDGVATFVAANGHPLLRASLVFRCGMADESFISTGWLHLLEHMALHGPVPAHVEVNGSVGLLFTSLDVTGEPDDVAQHLSAISQRLTRIDPGVLAHETRVLGAENRRRRGGPLSEALLWRFGAQGPGLADSGEPGVSRATPEGLEQLALEAFAAQNAVLCLSGPVPSGLRLRLPTGTCWPAPPLEPWDQPLPSVYRHSSDSIILSGLVERGTAAVAASSLLSGRVVDQLRHREGLTYSPGGTYEVLGSETALAAVSADVLPRDTGAALPVMMGAALDLAWNGPSSQELADYVRNAVRSAMDPLRWPARAWAEGRDYLLSLTTISLVQQIDDLNNLTREAVGASAQQVCDSMMTGIPADATADLAGLTVLRGPENHSMPGKAYRPANGAGALVGAESRVIVNGTYLQRRSPGSNLTVDTANLAGVMTWPDGARRLIRPDGYVLHHEPTLWHRGKRLTAWIDARVPGDRLLPQPERSADEVPRPLTVKERIFRASPWTLVLYAVAAFLLALLPFALATSVATSQPVLAAPVIGGLLIVAFAIYLKGLISERERR